MNGFLVCLLLVLGCTIVRAQNDTATSNNSTSSNITTEPRFLGPSPVVFTTFLFPDHQDLGLPAVDVIDILLGFSNVFEPEEEVEGVEAQERAVAPIFNVTMIFASLNHPQDFKYFIQNYSRFDYSLLVGAGEQATFNYQFRPDPLLEPRDFGLLVHAVYVDLTTNITHFHTFFNGTIEIIEPYTAFDVQLLFTYTLIVGVLGLIGFALYNKFATGKKSTTSRRVVAETGTRQASSTDDAETENDWLVGTSADPALAAKAPKNRNAPYKSPARSRQ